MGTKTKTLEGKSDKLLFGKSKKYLKSKIVIGFLCVVILPEVAYASLSTGPWRFENIWQGNAIEERIESIREWIANNIGERESVTRPWSATGEIDTGTSLAENISAQKEWQFLKRRVRKDDPITVEDRNKIVTNHNANREYFIPNRSQTEWDRFELAVEGGRVPDLSMEDAWTYSWAIGNYGNCSVSCGGGTKVRSVECERDDLIIVADSFCTAAKPIATQSCNTQSCSHTFNNPRKNGRLIATFSGNGWSTWNKWCQEQGYSSASNPIMGRTAYPCCGNRSGRNRFTSWRCDWNCNYATLARITCNP